MGGGNLLLTVPCRVQAAATSL